MKRKRDPNPNPFWHNDELQFRRLIAEVEAAGGFTPELLKTLQTEMDLSEAELLSLIDRAQAAFDEGKTNCDQT